MFAPLTSCASDQLRATFEVLAPDSSPVEHTATALVTSADFRVESTVTFTPTTAGTHVVRAVFEPSLGVRSTTVDVFANAARDAVVVPLPAGVTCSKPPWPVSADTFACESPNDVVSVVSADGGTERFTGRSLVAVGDVLWSETQLGELERREPGDGGFAVTNRWPGYGSTPIRGLHTRTTAVRRKNMSNVLVGAVSIDGGWRESFFSLGDLETALFFYEHDTAVRSAGGNCAPCLSSLVAFDPEVAWQQFGSQSMLQGFRRPIADDTQFKGAQHNLQLVARPGLPAQEHLERWPLWLDPSERTDLSVLVTPHAGALRWSVWPRGQVLRVGPEFVSLKHDAGVRIAPIP
jgi:hypothetical protein